MPDASHAVRRRGRGTTTASSRGHHMTMQNACNTKHLNQQGHACACTPSHLHDACTVRDSTVSKCVGGASRPRRHTAPRRCLRTVTKHRRICWLLSTDEVKLQLPRVHSLCSKEWAARGCRVPQHQDTSTTYSLNRLCVLLSQ